MSCFTQHSSSPLYLTHHSSSAFYFSHHSSSSCCFTQSVKLFRLLHSSLKLVLLLILNPALPLTSHTTQALVTCFRKTPLVCVSRWQSDFTYSAPFSPSCCFQMLFVRLSVAKLWDAVLFSSLVGSFLFLVLPFLAFSYAFFYQALLLFLFFLFFNLSYGSPTSRICEEGACKMKSSHWLSEWLLFFSAFFLAFFYFFICLSA